MKFSAWPDRADVKAPRLGEHNEEVLRELLGLSDGEIADLLPPSGSWSNTNRQPMHKPESLPRSVG